MIDDGGEVMVVARMTCFVVEFVKRVRAEVRRCLAMLVRFADGEAESEKMSGDGGDIYDSGCHLLRVVIKCVDVMASGTVDSLPLVIECRESSDAVTDRSEDEPGRKKAEQETMMICTGLIFIFGSLLL